MKYIYLYKKERAVNKINLIICTILSLGLGVLIGFYFKIGLPWHDRATLFVLISSAGAFGGLLYTARDSGLEFPHFDPEKKHVLNLGWVADCAYGIAGAFVVFLILPTELANNNSGLSFKTLPTIGFVKLVAIALVGGYGGRSLVDRALANIAKDAEEAKEFAKEAKENLARTQTIDSVALELTHLYLETLETSA